MAWIYKIEDDIDHKVYIGQTIHKVEVRFHQHLKNSENAKDNTRLHSAMRNLGKDHFFCEVIEECKETELDEREKYWIKYYDSLTSGYNMTSGGNGGSIYQIDETEIRKLWDEGKSLKEIAGLFGCSTKAISDRLSNYKNYSVEEAVKRSNAKVVYQYDLAGMRCGEYESVSEAEVALNGEEARGRDNIGACARGEQRITYGYYWSYEKMDKGPTLYIIKGITCPIVQFSKEGEWIATYDSLADAERAMQEKGYKRPHIAEVCKKLPKYKTACGYVWRYLYDEELSKPVQSSVAELATLLDD